MESRGDKLRALGLALLIHATVLLALLVGLWWTHETRPVVMPGPVIEATLVGPTAAPKRTSSAAKPEPPKPEPAKPEPVKPEPPKPEPPKPEEKPPVAQPTPPTKQDTIEREKVAALAREEAEKEKREQAEKVRQEQILLEQEQEREKQLEDIRKQREAAERKLKIEKQKMAQLEDRARADERRAEQQKAERAQPQAEQEAPEAQTGANGQDNDLNARYAAAIQVAVTRAWNRPDSAASGLLCTLNIIQIPGGDVISANVTSPCNADGPTRLSIEQAAMRAAPLPYQGYEKVFQRQINFKFHYDG
ncbi:MAG: cell envelope integrity protein TolA [Dokdonella sp.]